jgi:lipoprotein Spr
MVAGTNNRDEYVPVHYTEYYPSKKNDNEAVSSVQLKYAGLLNTDVESLPSKALLENVDEWYGVHYRSGGNTKSGVDCSGFTVAVYAAVYGITLPRVSRDQYRTSRKISTTELQEGDLVFFNTRGYGVSHVGIYLGNNRFIHASVSRGVMVSSLFEPYYLQRFVGAGRIDDKQIVASN